MLLLPLMLPPLQLAVGPADHAAVRDTMLAAFNNFSSVPSKMAALLAPEADWCDPYPSCVHGKLAIHKFLTSMPPGTDTILLAEPMVTVGPVGGMMATLSFSWPGDSDSCLYTADQHVSWHLADTDTPTLSYVRWVYNASEFDAAVSACLGPGASRLLKRGEEPDRAADLQTVKDYVVGLQYSLPAQALICDLLVPTARYCDPYPVRCATGRSGCRAMKGLPPAWWRAPPAASTALPLGGVEQQAVAPAGAAAGATVEAPSVQTRPASVRPLMPSGPITGATYIAYSSARRGKPFGRLGSHKLHHTWAIWELAPLNGSAPTPPVPMLASFDWFMPDRNL